MLDSPGPLNVGQNEVDVLIVGMGLAGIHASMHLREIGKQVHHIHASMPGESTKVAAGLINPITGRRYVKSWMIDEVMPYAVQQYTKLESLLGGKYIRNLDIIRVLKDPGDENTWLSKSADPYLKQFLSDTIIEGSCHPGICSFPMMGKLLGCYRIDVMSLQRDYIDRMSSENVLTNEVFDYQSLVCDEATFTYKGLKASKIIFAEGWRAWYNPFIANDGFSPVKGNLLMIHAPSLKLDTAFKKEQFITPVGNDIYWVGATYEWQNFDPSPDDKKHREIKARLDEVLDAPYSIVSALAGIRPASKNRKPIVGSHKQYKNMYFFNGLGTKGSSLGAYFAKNLVAYMYDQTVLADAINVEKFTC